MTGKYFICMRKPTNDFKELEIVKEIVSGKIITFDGYKYGIHKNKKLNRFVITDIKTGRSITSCQYETSIMDTLENLKDKLSIAHSSENYKIQIKELEGARWII